MLVGLALVALLLGCCLWLVSRKYRHYPGLGIPVIGDLYAAATTYTNSFEKLLNDLDEGFDKFGDTYVKWFGPAVVIATADPYLIEELSYHPMMSEKEPLIYNSFYNILHGPFSKTRADKTWKHFRKNIVSYMSKPKLEMYQEVFGRRGRELVEVLEDEKELFDLQPYVLLMGLDVVMESLVGINSSNLKNRNTDSYEDFIRLNNEVMERVLSFGFKSLDRKFGMSLTHAFPMMLKILDDLMSGLRAREVESRSDIVIDDEHLMKQIIREGVEKGETQWSLMCHLNETFLEAFYTSGVILSSALLYLSLYPEFQETAWLEQNEIFGDSQETPTTNDLKRMVYLDRIVKETVRLVSAPCFPRRCREDIKIGNHFIPKNSTVLYSFHRLRRDPRYWKTPYQFNPDHWLPKEVASRPKCAFLGFGVGTRNCPGYNYALNFIKVVLSIMLRRFKIFTPLKPDEIKFQPAIFMTSKVPHTVSLESRI